MLNFYRFKLYTQYCNTNLRTLRCVVTLSLLITTSFIHTAVRIERLFSFLSLFFPFPLLFSLLCPISQPNSSLLYCSEFWQNSTTNCRIGCILSANRNISDSGGSTLGPGGTGPQNLSQPLPPNFVRVI